MEPDSALKAVEAWMKGAHPPPLSMEIALTRRCNLKCIFCSYLDSVPSDEELSLAEWLRIVREAGEMGVPEIALAGGGEPFFEPSRALEVMRAIKAQGMGGSVTTNGLLSGKTVDAIVDMAWNHVVVSLDGPDPESHDFMRNRAGLFEKTVRTIERLRNRKRDTRSDLPVVHINMILSNCTHTKLARMFRLASALGVTRVNILPLLDHMPSSHVARLSSGDLKGFREHAKAALAVAQQLSIESNLPDLMDGLLVEKQMETDAVILADAGLENRTCRTAADDLAKIPCYFPWTHLVVHSSGHVKPCIQEEPASYLDGRPLKEVWESDPHLASLREGMLRGELPKMCSSCCAPVIGKNRRIREYARLRQSRISAV